MKWKKKRLAALLVVLALAATAAVANHALQPALGGTGPDRQVIARSSSNGFRVTVTAYKSDASAAPAATVKIAAFGFSGGSWHQLGSPLRVGARDTWFWNVVTGPHSLRNFSLSTDVPERVTLRLLITPSIGWSDPYSFHVAGGALVRG